MWVINVFSGDRRRPIVDKTAAASSRNASASVWAPATTSAQNSRNSSKSPSSDSPFG
jgi:hypothetical protein